MRLTICILLVLHQQGLVSLQECYTCPSGRVGLHEHAGSCYYFSPSGLNHAEASDLCSEHEYHLAFIESVEEQDYIRTYMEENNIEDCWMGLTVNSAGEGVWLDGSLLTYENFQDNSFNEGGECFRIAASYDYHWHDRDCSHIFSYICEKEIECSPSTTMTTTALLTTQKPIIEEETTTFSTTSPQITTSITTTKQPSTEIETTTTHQPTREKQIVTSITTKLLSEEETTRSITTTQQSTTKEKTKISTITQKPTTEEGAASSITTTKQSTTQYITSKITQKPTTARHTTCTTTTQQPKTEETTTYTSTTKEPTTEKETAVFITTSKVTAKELSSTSHKKSNRFGMIAQNSSIKEIAVAEKHTASTLVQCASACMTMSSCSSFTFIEVDRDCLIGGPAIESENFERRNGAKTFGII